MALWFNLRAGSQPIGHVEIQRREHLDLTDPAAIADLWSTYDVRCDGRLVGQVRHCYGHGAWKLLTLAASLLDEDARVGASPALPPAEPPTRRLRACVEAWPNAETGEYNPACCRFPKSCSATIYDPETVAETDLEPELKADHA